MARRGAGPRGAHVTAGENGAGRQRRTDVDVRPSPFTRRQAIRLDQVLQTANRSTGLTFSVYVGDVDDPVRDHAERLHGQLADPDRSVLVAVSPNQRVVEIVTGAQTRRRLPDRACRLAALSMTAAFAGGDLTGGLVAGLAQLADQAGGADRTR